MSRIIVIGGGPAGLMAAVTAASEGARVLLIEKTARLGNKLRLTGGGHGNVTRVGGVEAHLAHIVRNRGFARRALELLDAQALRGFLDAHGVATIVDERGRVFPASRNAHQLASTLRALCLERGVTFRFQSPVDALNVSDGAISGVLVGEREIAASAVVLATGGQSYPKTGSDGSGFCLAAALGHSIVTPQPGLAPLRGDRRDLDSLRGLTLADVVVSLAQEGHELARRRGDLLFTGEGFSGPVVHNLSLFLPATISALSLNLHWLESQGLACNALREQADAMPRRAWHSALWNQAPTRLARYVAQRADIALGLPWLALDARARERTVSLARVLPFEVRDVAPLSEAMVTLGGVSVDEMDRDTMGSLLVRGLFMAGEVLDLTGESGGYNLQLAFATGHLAGLSAAQWWHGREGIA